MKAWSSDQLEQQLGALIEAETEFQKCEALMVESDRRDNAIKVIFDAANEAVAAYNKLKEL